MAARARAQDTSAERCFSAAAASSSGCRLLSASSGRPRPASASACIGRHAIQAGSGAAISVMVVKKPSAARTPSASPAACASLARVAAASPCVASSGGHPGLSRIFRCSPAAARPRPASGAAATAWHSGSIQCCSASPAIDAASSACRTASSHAPSRYSVSERKASAPSA